MMDDASTLEPSVRPAAPGAPPETVRFSRGLRWLEWALLAVAAFFYALHFLHLQADFPNHSPWVDWAKYTDEGWYGDAAIRHYQWGHWNLPGDFNPAAALPVWPLLLLALFRITGVSLVAVRALTVVILGLILAASFLLLRRWPVRSSFSFRSPSTPSASFRGDSLAPGIAVLLLAVNPFCFAFSRIAILEPLLILLGLVALGIAGRAGKSAAAAGLLDRQAFAWAAGLGLTLLLLVLTKTTGVVLFPAVFYLLWGATGSRWLPSLRLAAIAFAVCVAGWGAYYGLVVHPHFLADYRYLFAANAYTKITSATFWTVLQQTLLDGAWIGRMLFWIALLALTGWSIVSVAARFRGNPLPFALVLWVLGYAAFLAYHANFSPRYYMVVAIPLTLLLALGFDALWDFVRRTSLRDGALRRNVRLWSARLLSISAALAIAVIAISGARRTIDYAFHPEYTFVTAAHRLGDAIEREAAAHPGHPRLLLSISGSELSLITGLPSICDDFGTMELPDRVAAYRPGWFATWNEVEDDKMDALTPAYKLVRVGAYPAFDDPDRNLLILYRLDPVNPPAAGRSRLRNRIHSNRPRARRIPAPSAAAGQPASSSR